MPDAPGAVRTPLRDIANNSIYQQTFSPGIPLAPSTQEPLRGWDFPVNVNSTIKPRTYEPFGFAHLRSFANVELVRMAIETRKDQLERQDWAIKVRDNKKGGDSRIKDLTTFWAKPDGVTPFSGWLRGMVEDLLSIDAATAEKRRSRGGKLIGLELIPGDTIAVKVDGTGRVPRGPTDVAYQQVIKGIVWNDLTNRDLLYVPRNLRPGHVYGFSPVEQIVITVNTIIRRQAAQLAHFTASNIPAGLMNAPEGWNLDKIKELQDWLDDKITGNTSEQAKLLWGPAGSKYTAFKDSPIKDDFDEWLARMVAFAFSLPPTPFIRQMNKGTANEDQDRALEEGLEPLKLWAKRWIDDIIATEFNAPDLEFVFIDTPSIDPKVQAEVDDLNLRNGSTTLDEVRDARGEDPYPDGMGKEPLVFTSTGPVLLKDVLAEPEPVPVEPGAPAQLVDENGKPVPHDPSAPPPPAHGVAAAAPPAGSPPKKAPPPPTAAKIAKARDVSKLISPDRPKARRAAAAAAKAIRPLLAQAGDEVAAEVEKALAKMTKDATPADPIKTATGIAASVDLSALADLGDAIEEDIADLAKDSGQLAIESVLTLDPDDSMFDQVFGRAADYAKARAAELVSVQGDQSVVASTRRMIRDTIAKGLADNIGARAIADSLQAAYAFSPQRAQLIAQNEIAVANGAGKKAGWQEVTDSGVTLVKDWYVSGDEGVCEDCEGNAAAGDVPFDDAFPSGDDMEPAHPGCRCVTTARTADDGDTGADDDQSDDEG